MAVETFACYVEGFQPLDGREEFGVHAAWPERHHGTEIVRPAHPEKDLAAEAGAAGSRTVAVAVIEVARSSNRV
ncbi:MAG TPA: hypothetical protein VH988_27635 [Thermoanaerobaculia bacterium]|jgi:hypothetical protein|nr:hypothetical protein [Thermoanaerobaculia bacterium]